MGEIKFFSGAILMTIGVILLVMGLDYAILNYHPVWQEIRTILEQANIYQDGVLTVSQVEYLSHLAEHNIVYYHHIYIIFFAVSLVFLILYLTAPYPFFKTFFSVFLVFVSFVLCVIISNENRDDKHSSIINAYPSEDYFLQVKNLYKNNKEINRIVYSYRNRISSKDLERFFEDQKL